MITLGRSTTSAHILDGSRKALCGFPNTFREVLEMEDLTLFDRSMDGRLCERCLKSFQGADMESRGRERAGPTTYAEGHASAKTGAPRQQASGSSQSSDPIRPAKDLSMAPQHLKHKLSQLTELKDALLSGEIHYPAYIRKALPLQKEIQDLEALTK